MELVINFIISLFLGMLPEVLFLTLFIIFSGNKKDKRLKLFIYLMIGYILLVMVCRYQLIFYIAYIIYSYLVVRKLYKAHISDLFINSIGYVYLTLMSFLCFKLIPNYWIALVINRIMLFIPFIFRKYFNKFYLKYKSLWNVNKNAKIKSITLRNISLLTINLLIVIMNFMMVIAINYYIKVLGG